MSGVVEPDHRCVQRAGEQGQFFSHAHRQRDLRAEVGGRHAHLADDPAEQRSRRVCGVPRLLERQEPTEETVHAGAYLRGNRPEYRVAGVRVLL